VGRGLVERAMDTSEEVNPRAQIEAAEEELYKVAADGGSDNQIKTFVQASTITIKMAEVALNSGGHISGITTGLESLNAKIGGMHRSDLM
ncbi:replicative DNA helicase, partial [Pseudomonas sp. MPR-LB5]